MLMLHMQMRSLFPALAALSPFETAVMEHKADAPAHADHRRQNAAGCTTHLHSARDITRFMANGSNGAHVLLVVPAPSKPVPSVPEHNISSQKYCDAASDVEIATSCHQTFLQCRLPDKRQSPATIRSFVWRLRPTTPSTATTSLVIRY